MDIQNGTAAGPSRGLLDVLFGTKGAEKDDAEGAGFKPLMELIKALKENGEKENGNRTDEEISSGKNVAEGQVVGMLGMFPFAPQQTQVNPEAIMQDGSVKDSAPKATGDALQLKSTEVNMLMQEKGMPKLTAEEEKLLGEVNARLATAVALAANKGKANGGESAEGVVPEMEVAPAVLANVPKEQQSAKSEQESKVLGDKAILQQGAPAPFLSTEAYLQLHQGKPAPKEVSKGENERVAVASPLVAGSVEDKNSSEKPQNQSKDLFSKGQMPKLDKSASGKKHLEQGAFDASLFSALKGGGETKEVNIQSTNPMEVRNTLVGEVNQSVSLQALKGGGEMRLVINPEDMGEVKLQVASKNGKVEVRVTAENENVAKLIRSGSQELEGSLKSQNLVLTKLEVTVSEGVSASSDSKGSSGDQLFQQQQQPNQDFSRGFNSSSSDRGFAQWNGDGDNPRSYQSYSGNYENEGRSGSPVSAATSQRARYSDSSRRLDVVA